MGSYIIRLSSDLELEAEVYEKRFVGGAVKTVIVPTASAQQWLDARRGILNLLVDLDVLADDDLL